MTELDINQLAADVAIFHARVDNLEAAFQATQRLFSETQSLVSELSSHALPDEAYVPPLVPSFDAPLVSD